MRPIIGVVHKDEGSAYGVSFPDAPGCFAAADELDGLIPAAVEALTLWAEEGGLPTPRDMEAVRAEVADELAQGAALVAVPLVVRRARAPAGERLARTGRARSDRRRGAATGHDALGLPRRGSTQRDRGKALGDASGKGPQAGSSQFSTRSPSTRMNSRRLAVTTTRSEARACAAISRSLPPMGVPTASNAVRISP